MINIEKQKKPPRLFQVPEKASGKRIETSMKHQRRDVFFIDDLLPS